MDTGYLLWGDRYAGAEPVRATARALQDSAVVDYVMVPDQYVNFMPPALWTAENTPMAKVVPDADSMMDGVALAGLIVGAAPDLGIILSTDSNRRGPVEFTQTAATLAAMTDGKAQLWVGSGEAKNVLPLGYKRRGLGKMEDSFTVFNQIWGDTSPQDYDGNFWKLDAAAIGGCRQHRPKIFGMGEGPRLIDIATSEADGLASLMPWKFQTPEHCVERMDSARKAVADKGRDPKAFEFGMDLMILCHPDEAVVDRAMDSPLVKWMTVMGGRIGADNWRESGLEPPTPEDWLYFADWLPSKADSTFVDDALAKITRKHVEACWFYGTPDQVEQQLAGLCDIDLSVLVILNYVGLTVSPEQAPEVLATDIDLCARIKARTTVSPQLSSR
jgi:phthiodiolone/phenolphthiodiolone dimycocerosates ketoreductase